MTFKQVPLGDLCKEVYRYPTYYDIEYIADGIPEIRGELIKNDGTLILDKKDWRFISSRTSSKFPRTVLVEGDLVMSVRGTIGKVAVVPADFEGANMTANLLRISPDRSRVDEHYLWRFMRSPKFIAGKEHRLRVPICSGGAKWVLCAFDRVGPSQTRSQCGSRRARRNQS